MLFNESDLYCDNSVLNYRACKFVWTYQSRIICTSSRFARFCRNKRYGPIRVRTVSWLCSMTTLFYTGYFKTLLYAGGNAGTAWGATEPFPPPLKLPKLWHKMHFFYKNIQKFSGSGAPHLLTIFKIVFKPHHMHDFSLLAVVFSQSIALNKPVKF